MLESSVRTVHKTNCPFPLASTRSVSATCVTSGWYSNILQAPPRTPPEIGSAKGCLFAPADTIYDIIEYHRYSDYLWRPLKTVQENAYHCADNRSKIKDPGQTLKSFHLLTRLWASLLMSLLSILFISCLFPGEGGSKHPKCLCWKQVLFFATWHVGFRRPVMVCESVLPWLTPEAYPSIGYQYP